MSTQPFTLRQLRAACAIAGTRLNFNGRHFVAKRNGHEILIPKITGDRLAYRGLARLLHQTPGARARPKLVGIRLTPKGERLVRANPPLCIGCGCTDLRACAGGCGWIAPGWCTTCDETAISIAAGAGGCK